MALNLRNIGQRLLDSTTIDEKIGGVFSSAKQYFTPKTGTLATIGRRWAEELAQRPVNMAKPIPGVSVAGYGVTPDMLLGGMRGVASNLAGFTGLENKLPQFKTFTSYNPQTTAGKVSQVAGAIGGTLLPNPLGIGGKLISKAPLVSMAQKQIGTGAGKLIAKGGLSKLAGTGVANLSQGLPYSMAFAGLQNINKETRGKQSLKDLGVNLGQDLALGALPFAGPLLVGMTKTQGRKEIASALQNEPGIMSLADLASKASKYKTAEGLNNKNLIAQHNIKPQGVLHAEKMGGLPLPSIAISRKDYPLENFGDISLLAGNELYDPKIRTNKIYNADAYSPRYPSINYKVDYKKAEQNLSPIIEETRRYFNNSSTVVPRYIDNYGSPVRAILEGGDFERKGSDLIENSDLIKGYFAMKKGVRPSADYKEIYNIIENNRPEFTKFTQDLTNSIVDKEQLFKGYTQSGNRRYIPHTLDNVVKEMKSAMGEGEGFNYGLGTIRSKVAKKYTKLSDIKKDRSKIISEKDFEEVRKSLDKEWDKIMEDGVSHSSSSEFGEYDRFSNALVDGIKRGNIKAELEDFGFKGVDTIRIEKFLEKVREAPTEYFEVKPQRAVDLSEFKVGVVPDDVDKSILDILRSKGIKVYTYAKGQRAKVIKEVADQNNMAFGMVAGFEPEYDEDGKLTGIKYNTAKGLAGFAMMAGVKSKSGQKLLGDINLKLSTLDNQATGAGQATDLLEEARKYKSAEEFKLFNKATRGTTSEYLQRETGIEFRPTESNGRFKLFKDGKEIGSFTGGNIVKTRSLPGTPKNELVINNIYIKPEYRGKNYGSSIVDAMKQASELTETPLYATDVMNNSATYWKKMGFNTPMTPGSMGTTGNAEYLPKQSLTSLYNQATGAGKGKWEYQPLPDFEGDFYRNSVTGDVKSAVELKQQGITPEPISIKQEQPKVFQATGKPTIKGVTTKPEVPQVTEPPKLNIQTPSQQTTSYKTSESIIPVGKKLEAEQKVVGSQLQENQAKAEIAQLERSNFSNQTIKDINILKRVANTDKFASGDVETFRKEYPKLTENVIEAVRENQQYEGLSDSEALDIALNLPTKEMTKIKRVETANLRALQRETDLQTKDFNKDFGEAVTKADFDKATKEWERAISDEANGITRHGRSVSVEPSFKTKQNLIPKAVEDMEATKEWQKNVFGEAKTRTTNQAMKDLEAAVKKNTNESSFNLDNADTWKDKNMLSLGRETMDRNFEDIMRTQSSELKRKLLDPVYRAEAERTRFLNKERAEIKSLGIKQGSKESALVQQYGEGKMTLEELKKQTNNPEKIVKASGVLRSKYDTYLTKLNTVLTRNGYDPIPKRSDYFHHFEELTGIFDQVGVSLKASDLPTDINGLTADFKPGKTFFSAALQRKGDKSAIDAIGGIDKYLEGASNQIYHTDNIQALRSFENALREKYAGTDHLTNFVSALTEYTNGIAGKKAMIDRAAEAVVGRKIYEGANILKRQVGANMVGANVSSTLTNFIPLTQTLATTNKGSVLQALASTISNVAKDDRFINKSNFLTTRLGSDNLSSNLWKSTQDKAGWLFKSVDSFVSQIVVRSKYLEGLKKGMGEESAIKYADDWARKLMAGRGKGEIPNLFNSKTLGFLTQFQLEVNNQLSFMGKDIPRNFDRVGAASAMAQLFLYSYLFNNLYENVAGRRPAFDPIGLAQNTYEDYTNEDMKKGQATKNLVSNVSNQLPFVSTFTGGRLPISSAIPNLFAVVSGESNLKKELTKPLQFMLPAGGGQIKKTIEGIGAYNRGYSKSPSGRVRFVIPQTTGNRVKTAVFGQWSTPEAQKYLREGQSVLGEKQTEKIINSTDKVGEFAKIKAKSLQDSKETKIKDELKKSNNGEVAKLGEGRYTWYDPQKDENVTIDISKPIEQPTLTGQTELDKKLKSAYKGKITSRINDIVKLYEAGQIKQDEAEKMIKELQTKSGSRSTKPKKISIKVSKPKTIKFKIAKATKMTPIKSFTTKKRKLSLKNYKPKKIVV